jgi:hypothetical protein
LGDHIRPIVAIAGKITKTQTSPTPDIQTMRMPKRRTSDLGLRLKTLGIAKAAVPYADQYVAQQMSPDFAKQARRAAICASATGADWRVRVVDRTLQEWVVETPARPRGVVMVSHTVGGAS